MLFQCHVIFSAVLVFHTFAASASPTFRNTENLLKEKEARSTIDLSSLGPSIYGRPDESSGIKVQEWLSTNGAGNAEEQGTYSEGDILFPNPLLRNGLISEARHWEDAVVPVEIDKSFSKEDVNQIKRAMREYHTSTCIKFVERIPSDQDYLFIQNTRTGCWSSIGRVGGRQELNLQSEGCTNKVGTIMHEMMHALGFFHEHSREDRDSHITVQWQNIRDNEDGNFRKVAKGEVSTLGLGYDYGSLQHYSTTAFSRNGQKTITANRPTDEAKMGQRDKFSELDLKKINAMYKCGSKVKRNQSLNWLDEMINFWGRV